MSIRVGTNIQRPKGVKRKIEPVVAYVDDDTLRTAAARANIETEDSMSINIFKKQGGKITPMGKPKVNVDDVALHGQVLSANATKRTSGSANADLLRKILADLGTADIIREHVARGASMTIRQNDSGMEHELTMAEMIERADRIDHETLQRFNSIVLGLAISLQGYIQKGVAKVVEREDGVFVLRMPGGDEDAADAESQKAVADAIEGSGS